MKIENLVFIATTILLSGLLYSIMAISNPHDQKYDQLIQKMMVEEALDHPEELFLQHPELIELKEQIQTVQQMRYNILQSSWQAIPPDEAQSLQLLHQRKQIDHLESNLQHQMEEVEVRRIVMED